MQMNEQMRNVQQEGRMEELVYSTFAFIGVLQQGLITAAKDCIVAKKETPSLANFPWQEVAAVKTPSPAVSGFSRSSSSNLCTTASPLLYGQTSRDSIRLTFGTKTIHLYFKRLT
ncbi:hypothetical protein NQZ68_033416 [Dissostichus eleginoides]|nr:hypothetical protein NQZ68_033416 [Dissostichus eleginoides]